MTVGMVLEEFFESEESEVSVRSEETAQGLMHSERFHKPLLLRDKYLCKFYRFCLYSQLKMDSSPITYKAMTL